MAIGQDSPTARQRKERKRQPDHQILGYAPCRLHTPHPPASIKADDLLYAGYVSTLDTSSLIIRVPQGKYKSKIRCFQKKCRGRPHGADRTCAVQFTVHPDRVEESC